MRSAYAGMTPPAPRADGLGGMLSLKYFVATVEEIGVSARLGRLIEAMLGYPCIWFSGREAIKL